MWKVYDIAIDGVSLLSSSQSQIVRLTQHFGYGGMMKLLKLKQSQLVMEQSPQSTKIGQVDPSASEPMTAASSAEAAGVGWQSRGRGHVSSEDLRRLDARLRGDGDDAAACLMRDHR
jgi:hypothetical protein